MKTDNREPESPAAESPSEAPAGRSLWSHAWRQLRRMPLAVASFWVIGPPRRLRKVSVC